MPSKSKTKGSSFERHIATFLTETYNSTFLRVFGSGAFVGGSNNFRKELLGNHQIQSAKGDIYPPEDWKKLNIECKSYAEFPFHQLFTSDVKLLDQWIAQVYDAADFYDLNILFMKFNRKGKWVAFENIVPFEVNRSIQYKDWTFCSWDLFWENEDNREKFKSFAQSGTASLPSS